MPNPEQLDRTKAAERDKLLRIDTPAGGIAGFSGVTAETLEQLHTLGVLDMESAVNSSPTAGEFAEWIKGRPAFTAFGYAVGPERYDYRVSIEGLSSRRVSVRDALAFALRFRDADELDADPTCCRCWYD